MLSFEDLDELENRLQNAIHVMINEFRARYGQISFHPSTRADHHEFSFTWPNKSSSEKFTNGIWYIVMSGNREVAQFLVALTEERVAWGRLRPRYVVFLQGRGKNSTTIYALTEFAQVDHPSTHHYAAKIPNPLQPSKFLQQGDPIPPELANAIVCPTQDLFDEVQGAKTLRRVVDLSNASGVEEMMQHAYWIGCLKKRL
jgi:hypothetical protein